MNKVFKIALLIIVLLAIPAGVYLVSRVSSTEYRAKAGKTEEVFVFIMPAEVKAERGERIDLAVKIDTAQETVGGVKLLISFKPSLLSLAEAVKPGSAFPGLTSQVQPGQVELNGQGELIGQGTIATLTFRAVGRGEGTIGVHSSSVVWNEEMTTNILGKATGARVVID